MFRPSSKGLNHISLSWKMCKEPDIFVHFSIKEFDKPIGGRGVGLRLEMDGQKFDDLDQIIAEYIERMNELVQEMRDDTKFKFGFQEDVDNMLKEEKEDHPRKNPYAINYSYDYPGRFVLSYILRDPKKVLHEYIAMTFKGFRFR